MMVRRDDSGRLRAGLATLLVAFRTDSASNIILVPSMLSLVQARVTVLNK